MEKCERIFGIELNMNLQLLPNIEDLIFYMFVLPDYHPFKVRDVLQNNSIFMPAEYDKCFNRIKSEFTDFVSELKAESDKGMKYKESFDDKIFIWMKIYNFPRVLEIERLRFLGVSIKCLTGIMVDSLIKLPASHLCLLIPFFIEYQAYLSNDKLDKLLDRYNFLQSEFVVIENKLTC